MCIYHKPADLLRVHIIFSLDFYNPSPPWSRFYYSTNFTAATGMMLLFILEENLLFLKTQTASQQTTMVKKKSTRPGGNCGWNHTSRAVPNQSYALAPRKTTSMFLRTLVNLFWHYSASMENYGSNQKDYLNSLQMRTRYTK